MVVNRIGGRERPRGSSTDAAAAGIHG